MVVLHRSSVPFSLYTYLSHITKTIYSSRAVVARDRLFSQSHFYTSQERTAFSIDTRKTMGDAMLPSKFMFTNRWMRKSLAGRKEVHF